MNQASIRVVCNMYNNKSECLTTEKTNTCKYFKQDEQISSTWCKDYHGTGNCKSKVAIKAAIDELFDTNG